MPELPNGFGQFLTFIGSAGAIGFVLSFLVEHWGFFQTRNQQGKVAILLFVSIFMGLLSYGLVTYIPAGVVQQAEPVYQRVIASITILLATQVWHKAVNKQDELKIMSVLGTGVPSGTFTQQGQSVGTANQPGTDKTAAPPTNIIDTLATLSEDQLAQVRTLLGLPLQG